MALLTSMESDNRNRIEVLLITKKSRAKSVDDKYARVYKPGEEGRFNGTAKIQLLAMGNATRNLNEEIPQKEKDNSNEPNLSVMKVADLKKEAEFLGIETKGLSKGELISEIKSQLKSVNR